VVTATTEIYEFNNQVAVSKGQRQHQFQGFSNLATRGKNCHMQAAMAAMSVSHSGGGFSIGAAQC